MTRKGKNIWFTQADRDNLIFKTLTEDELVSVRNKIKRDRIPLSAGFLTGAVIFFIMAVVCVHELRSAMTICLSASLTGFVANTLCYYWDLSRALGDRQYAEVVVTCKLPRERDSEYTAEYGPRSATFYPIRGVVPENGYEFLFYISKDEYESIKEGSVIRIKADV